jgi:hypothetical protein
VHKNRNGNLRSKKYPILENYTLSDILRNFKNLLLPLFLNKLKQRNERAVIAGIIEKPEDYLLSSAGDYYCEKKRLLEIEVI